MTLTPNRSVAELTVSLPVAKLGEFRTVLGGYLTQGSLKSLSFPAAFQADDEGSIPFTRSNVFNDLGGGAHGIVSRRAIALCQGAAISDCIRCREEPSPQREYTTDRAETALIILATNPRKFR
jgi:hypothetical protein